MFLVIIIAIIFFFFKLDFSKVKGSFGEFKVHTQLSFLGSDFISLNDILIKNPNGTTTQIDHVVLSEYGIFVIETKNYKGWIFGNEKSENWKQIIFNERYSFRNPVKQNWGHVYSLKAALSDFPSAKYYPIVVFAGSAILKDIDSTVPVIYESYLNSTIRNYCTEKCLSKNEVLLIKQRLESIELTDSWAKNNHIYNTRTIVKERQLKMANLICPRCNAQLKLRNGRNGKFYGCSNYPRCRFTMPY